MMNEAEPQPVKVSDIVGEFAKAQSIEGVLAKFPQLERSDVQEALNYAVTVINLPREIDDTSRIVAAILATGMAQAGRDPRVVDFYEQILVELSRRGLLRP